MLNINPDRAAEVSIISYNGEFACNMVLDAAQFAHPEALREAWDAELAALSARGSS